MTRVNKRLAVHKIVSLGGGALALVGHFENLQGNTMCDVFILIINAVEVVPQIEKEKLPRII